MFLVLALLLILIGFIRAPLTVLAPAEVNGQQRWAVAAPLDGVIEEVLVSPNSVVSADSVLARYVSTELKNALNIADKRAIVAHAELTKLQNASFASREAAGEIKIAEAELELAIAELKLAQERSSRIEILAGTQGIAIFEDTRKLTGVPVAVGERLMEIVNPAEKEFTIRLPVDDSIVLTEGAKVRVFLDSRPLSPIPGKLVSTSYRATAHEDGSFAYTLVARASPEEMKDLRIGAYGTAQVFGANYNLYFIVFRRPLSWLRQAFGF
jgi:multidrug efflux pump subunit AcrA (membrane-fusion protein)